MVVNLLERLPAVAERRIAVRLTPDALRQVRGGSPWVYDGSITSAAHAGAAGDLAVVFDERRRFAAIGLWDPDSPIRIKILHHGRPTAIDDSFWRSRVATALDRRVGFDDDPETTGYRCVHGENDGFPGLVVDRYAANLVVKVYSPAWFPHLAPVLAALVARLDPARVVLRLGRNVSDGETFGLGDGDVLVGEPPTGPVLFRERGLTMEADLVRGHKTGHFLDQRDNRALVRGMAAGADVLDVFAGTGGFSLAAAAGGARSVHLVDVAAPALATAERNRAHNRNRREVRDCSVRTTVGDAFEVLAELARRDERYDLVVIDPPSFASNQAGVERALRAYGRLTRAGLAVVRAGGVLVQSSCSARVTTDEFAQAVLGAAAAAGADVRELRRTGHPADHPIGFEFGGYLKSLYLSVAPGGS